MMLRRRKFRLKNSLTFIIFVAHHRILQITARLIVRLVVCHGIAGASSRQFADVVGDVGGRVLTRLITILIRIILPYHKQLWFVEAIVRCDRFHGIRWLDWPISWSEFLILLLFLLINLMLVGQTWGSGCLHGVLRISHIIFITLLIDHTVQLPRLLHNSFPFRFGAHFNVEEVLSLL